MCGVFFPPGYRRRGCWGRRGALDEKGGGLGGTGVTARVEGSRDTMKTVGAGDSGEPDGTWMLCR